MLERILSLDLFFHECTSKAGIRLSLRMKILVGAGRSAMIHVVRIVRKNCTGVDGLTGIVTNKWTNGEKAGIRWLQILMVIRITTDIFLTVNTND